MTPADTLRALHEAPDVLVLANVWDVASAKAVAAVDGVKAIATASHSIAAAHGYDDGEHIPLDLHMAAVQRITTAVEMPVTMDFESGYGDPEETTRRAIATGVAGGNLEDGMRPLTEATAAVDAVVAARDREGTGFVLNARTDAFLRAPADASPADTLATAIERGQAFLEHGAECVFVPGVGDAATIGRLAAALGRGRLSVIAGPGGPSIEELQQLGVARASIGPWGYRVALTALQDAAADLLAGGGLSTSVRVESLR